MITRGHMLVFKYNCQLPLVAKFTSSVPIFSILLHLWEMARRWRCKSTWIPANDSSATTGEHLTVLCRLCWPTQIRTCTYKHIHTHPCIPRHQKTYQIWSCHCYALIFISLPTVVLCIIFCSGIYSRVQNESRHKNKNKICTLHTEANNYLHHEAIMMIQSN